jgi:putative transposase
VLTELNSERFCDLAPYQVYAILLDEGRYLASPRTMYRLLAANHLVRERRDQRRAHTYAAPELLATRPNQLWSWDITKLRGPAKGRYFYLYVIIDVFSRYGVGWMLAEVERGELAEQLIADTLKKEGIERDQLTLHADRGSPMKSKPVTDLLVTLGIDRSHSRPHVSNDNPYSEAQFKTIKYHRTFPGAFGSVQDARGYFTGFFAWYNHEHRHSGIGLMTPAVIHRGDGELVRAARQVALDAAYAVHPERFVRMAPVHAPLPAAAWINPPNIGEVLPA